MSSIREQALAMTKTLLEAAGSPADKVTRSRLDQIQLSRDIRSVYDITPGDQKVDNPGEYGDQESVTYTLPVVIRALVDAGEAMGEDADPSIDVDDSELDPFYVFAVQQIMGGDQWLGGLVNNVREVSAATVFRPEGRAVIGLEMQFEYIFSTKRGDPTQKG